MYECLINDIMKVKWAMYCVIDELTSLIYKKSVKVPNMKMNLNCVLN